MEFGGLNVMFGSKFSAAELQPLEHKKLNLDAVAERLPIDKD